MGLAPLGYVLYSRVMRHNPLNPALARTATASCSRRATPACSSTRCCTSAATTSRSTTSSASASGAASAPATRSTGTPPGSRSRPGPLGQGFANAVGFALAEAQPAPPHFNRPATTIVDHHTYVDLQRRRHGGGDRLRGRRRWPGNLGLGKLIAIYDDNEISIEGSTHLAFHEEVGERFDAYGWSRPRAARWTPRWSRSSWRSREAQGVDRPAVADHRCPRTSATAARTSRTPRPPTARRSARRRSALTKENLGWPYEEPFTVPDEVHELFARGPGARRSRPSASGRSASRPTPPSTPTSRAELAAGSAGDAPRAAAGLGRCRGSSPASDADRHPGRLRQGAELARPEGPGAARRRRRPGAVDRDATSRTTPTSAATTSAAATSTSAIREHAMGAIVNALTIEGMRAYGATFLVFSDYMRGAIRLAALMEIPSIFVYTHDSIGVGEDGPTHQPIEHLASLRAMPNLEVIRPADANEAFLAWHWLLERRSVPTALVAEPPEAAGARPRRDSRRRGRARRLRPRRPRRGEPELILIGTGSEVSLCLEAADAAREGVAVAGRLDAEHHALRSSRTRRTATRSCRPASRARMSVEAGATFGWVRWVGDEGDERRHRPLRRLGAGRRDRRALRADRRRRRRARPRDADREGRADADRLRLRPRRGAPARHRLGALIGAGHEVVDLMETACAWTSCLGRTALRDDPGDDQSLGTSPRANDCLFATDGRKSPGNLWTISGRPELLTCKSVVLFEDVS